MAPGAVPGSADRRRCDGGCALLGGNASCVAAAAYHVPLRPLVLQGAASSKPKLYTQCALFEVDFGKMSAASVSASSRFSATYPAANPSPDLATHPAADSAADPTTNIGCVSPPPPTRPPTQMPDGNHPSADP